MSNNTYAIGDLVQITATFTTVSSGANVDPTSVVFTVHKPDGTNTTPAASKSSTGVYTAQVTIDQSGTWRWRATGTGAAVAASDDSFTVAANSF